MVNCEGKGKGVVNLSRKQDRLGLGVEEMRSEEEGSSPFEF